MEKDLYSTRKVSRRRRIRNVRKYIIKNGYFSPSAVGTEGVSGHNYGEVLFLRKVLDKALIDVLSYNEGELRDSTIEWFQTSAFDQLCDDAGLDVGYTFKLMQGVFDAYKQSPYGKNWKCPNVHPVRVSIIPQSGG